MPTQHKHSRGQHATQHLNRKTLFGNSNIFHIDIYIGDLRLILQRIDTNKIYLYIRFFTRLKENHISSIFEQKILIVKIFCHSSW